VASLILFHAGCGQCADGWPHNADLTALAKASVDAITHYGFGAENAFLEPYLD
jgi:hypothetical protein